LPAFAHTLTLISSLPLPRRITTRPGALLDGSAPPALQAIWDGRIDPKHTLATHTTA
jgi:hypothetical protein